MAAQDEKCNTKKQDEMLMVHFVKAVLKDHASNLCSVTSA